MAQRPRRREPPRSRHRPSRGLPERHGRLASQLLPWRSRPSKDKLGPLYHVFAALSAGVLTGDARFAWLAVSGESALRIIGLGGDRPDPEKALADRPYGARGELTIRIASDGMCPWNEGTYLLETDGASADVRRIDREPDLTVTPNVLASLLAGYRSATHFARAGRLEARDGEALRTADAIFRSEHAPYCPNGF